MSALAWFLWGLAALVFFWAIGAYNRMMRLRGAISAGYVRLDEQLGLRAQVCGKLVTLLRPLLPSEQSTFDALASAQDEAQGLAAQVRARPYAADAVAGLAVALAMHAAALTRLMSLLDHHAELREHAALHALIDELKQIEKQRSFTRQVFNEAVRAYNEALVQLPTRLLTGLFGFNEARSL